MLIKLALRNIRRSVRDYAIYFVTLVFGVAVFYAFNSIGSQDVLFDVREYGSDWLSMVQSFLSLFSAVVAVVLGFLVVYANRFLIRRRKHEFGIYQLLGMGPWRISGLVLCETAVVGIASLALGLALGVALSQGLSFVTAALMGAVMARYQFVFSSDALAATLSCFALIFVVVAAFNLIAVSNARLADLMQAQKRGERMVLRSPWLCLLVFLASVGILVYSYKLLSDHGIVLIEDPRFYGATALMLLGTLLFFWSVSGFATTFLQRIPGVYLRGLRAFTVRQVSERINTAFASLWAVCVLLFFSVTVFTVGMGMNDVFAGQVRDAALYDASMRADYYHESGTDAAVRTEDEMAGVQPDEYAEASIWGFSTLAKLEAEVHGWSDIVADASQLDVYVHPELAYADLITATVGSGGKDAAEMIDVEKLVFSGLSQFNETAVLAGKEPIVLSEGECAVNNAAAATDEIAQDLASASACVRIADRELFMVSDVVELQVATAAIPDTALLVVVPDEVIDDLRSQGVLPLYSYVNVQYVEDGEESDAFLAEAVAAVSASEGSETSELSVWPVSNFVLQSHMLEQAGGLRLLITYLAVYIGFVFLVATAAVLAIQQLTGVADSLPRYRQISHLGCDERVVLGSVRTQTCLYFVLPLALALSHAACAVWVLYRNVFSLVGADILLPIVVSAVLLMVIYGSYFIVTYLTSRSMVRVAIKH